ncbi:TonB-dependent hemoglobin/transferrin/lactoferrin family receptor [uncultured Cohaesibacter sp.]|uniref:TonB-dependent hemoglobin/transferrin/lactoferrin family receptor n=1 Tax=uncultured Cohaesibacter sp. TaxID=1002546 RepID=UPI0029C80B5B|nr:TonB-dependent hemoglobin/transferrin/lactoferrin family receptor [uncultured Cohaesibacter sp.]
MNKLLLVALAASTILSPVTHVMAQEVEEELTSDNFLDRIVVSAGEEKVAIDTPQAVSVLTQEDIDEAQPETVGDLFQFIPGVSTVGSEHPLGQSFNIRGIGAAAAADESKIIMQVDGVTKFFEQYRMGSLFMDPELLKRVEVLRGPASSTLYGSGALGGVISMTTKDASDFLKDEQTWAFKPKITASTNGKGVSTSGIFATRVNEAFEVLAAGSFRKADSYKDGNGDTIDNSDYQSLSGMVNAKFHFGEDMEQYVRLSAMQYYSDLNDTAYSQTGGVDFGLTDRKVTDRNVALEYVNPVLGNKYFDVKVNLGYSDTQNEQDDMQSIYASTFGDESEYGYTSYVAKLENTSDLSFGERIQHYLTLGTEYSFQERTSSYTYAGTTSTSLTHPEGTQAKVSGYAQSEIIINDRFTLIPGVRYDRYMNDPEDATQADKDIGAFSPKLAALVEVTDFLSLFGSVAYTERAPTLDEFYSSSAAGYRGPTYLPARSASPDLDPERSTNFEGGIALKFDNVFGRDRFTTKITAFQNNVRDLIESDSDGPTYYHNVDKARIHGIELEASYMAENLFARAAYSATRGKNQTDGTHLDSIAADTLSTSFGFLLPQYDVKVAWDSVYAADQEKVSTATMRTGGYGVHGLSASWTPDEGRFADIEARISVENIFDRDYRAHLSNDTAQGRTFKFTVSKIFGG